LQLADDPYHGIDRLSLRRVMASRLPALGSGIAALSLRVALTLCLVLGLRVARPLRIAMTVGVALSVALYVALTRPSLSRRFARIGGLGLLLCGARFFRQLLSQFCQLLETHIRPVTAYPKIRRQY
jgi:hypothetical protein